MITNEALSTTYEIEGLLMLLNDGAGDAERRERIVALLREKVATLTELVSEETPDAPEVTEAPEAPVESQPVIVDVEEPVEAPAEEPERQAAEEPVVEPIAEVVPAQVEVAEEVDDEPITFEYEITIDDVPEDEVEVAEPEAEGDEEPADEEVTLVVEAPAEEMAIEPSAEPTADHPCGISIQSRLTLNDRFRFRRELFHNSPEEMSRALNRISAMPSLQTAEKYVVDTLGLDPDNEHVAEFLRILRLSAPH